MRQLLNSNLKLNLEIIAKNIRLRKFEIVQSMPKSLKAIYQASII